MFQPLVNISLITVGFLGLIIIILLLFSYKSNPVTNIYLVLIFSFFSLRFILKGVFEINNPYLFEITFKWLNPFFLLVVPSFYLYFKALLNNNIQYNYKDLLHFIYPIINLIYVFALKKDILLVNDISSFIQFFCVIFAIIIYLILSFQLLNRKLWKNKKSQVTSDKHSRLIKNWTQFFYTILLLLTFRLLLSFYLNNNTTEKLFGFSFISFSIVLWLIIFIRILTQPEILFGLPMLEEKLSEYNNNSINSTIWQLSTAKITNLQDQRLTTGIENKITPYIQDIENFINTTHPFRDPNFSIKELSINLYIPASHLAYIFKYHCTTPFVEFKKYCKIEDAKKLIKENYLKTNTLESLSSEIGFIAYNTFYSSFKKYLNVSPKKYMDSIDRA